MSDPTPAFAASHLKRFSRENRLIAISEWPELLETLIKYVEETERLQLVAVKLREVLDSTEGIYCTLRTEAEAALAPVPRV